MTLPSYRKSNPLNAKEKMVIRVGLEPTTT